MTEPRTPGGVDPAGGRAALVAAWLLVGIPLAWGVYETVVKSMALFE